MRRFHKQTAKRRKIGHYFLLGEGGRELEEFGLIHPPFPPEAMRSQKSSPFPAIKRQLATSKEEEKANKQN